ncbi:lipoprotein [Klebsiella pneumoniae]|nr:lipoprotein [Klebsiella pneumoniae]
MLVTLPFASVQICAAAEPTAPLEPAYAYHGAEPADLPAPESRQPAAAASSSLLPLLGDEARKRGYVLPLPFGVSINYMDMRQNINVDSINFTGLSLDGRNIDCGKDPVCKHAVNNIFANGPVSLDNAFQIGVGHTRESSKTETLKLDAWLLPFMNVYGLVGHTEGHSISQIAVGLKGPNGKEVPLPGMQDLDFRLDFKGTTYGMGTTLVGGVGNWFTVLDANYTQTRFDILDGSIDALTFSPRVGYRFSTPSVDALHLPAGKLNLWVGSMYQDVQQEFKGSLSDLSMPSPMLQNMVNLANQDNNGRFDVKQHLQSPWNVLVGAGLPPQETSAAAFAAGLQRGINNPAVLPQLFEVRASHVLGALPREQVSEFLSGLLIGAEVATLSDTFAGQQAISLVAGSSLTSRYQQAFAAIGREVSAVAGDTAFQTGIRSIAYAVAN